MIVTLHCLHPLRIVTFAPAGVSYINALDAIWVCFAATLTFPRGSNQNKH